MPTIPSRSRERQSGRVRVFVAVLALVACGALVEGAARLAGFRPSAPDRATLETRLLISDPHLGFRYAPDAAEHNDAFVGRPLVTTDGQGHRRTLQERDATTSVLVCGDSMMFAAEVTDDATPSTRLAKFLQGEARVVNLGVRGYSTLQSLRALEAALDAEPDVAVAIYAYTPNDLFENLYPFHRLPRQVPTAWWDGAGLAIHDPGPCDVPWGERFLDHRDAIRPVEDLRGEAFAALSGDDPRFEALRDLGRVVVASDEGRRARGVVSTPTGLMARLRQSSAALNRLSTLRYDAGSSKVAHAAATDRANGHAGGFGVAKSIVPLLEWSVENDGEQVLVALMQRMQDACDAKGVTLLVCATRVAASNTAAARFEELAGAAGLNVIPTAQAFVEDPEHYVSQRINGALDNHWNDEGCAAFARALEGPTRNALAARSQR